MTVVHLTGSIDHRAVPGARRHLLAELSRDNLDIDLADVTQIDTSGLATMVEVFQVARRKGREVHLIHLNGNVRKMVRLAHLEDLFSIGACAEDRNVQSCVVDSVPLRLADPEAPTHYTEEPPRRAVTELLTAPPTPARVGVAPGHISEILQSSYRRV